VFTGIIEERGRVEAIDGGPDFARLRVVGPLVSVDAMVGASIAVNGVCLTVVEPQADGFTADVMGETLRNSALGSLAPGDQVNLERAMPATGRWGGHIVQGHVDGVGEVLDVRAGQEWTVVRVAVPTDLARYVVRKGSITVDGVSLTVSAVAPPNTDAPWFEVSLIPTTLALTTLGLVDPGARVNLEVDIVAKYVERMLEGVRG
jgi:riboflavin synthase